LRDAWRVRSHLGQLVPHGGADRKSELRAGSSGLWRAVDDEGEVPDLLVQRRRDKAATVKLIRKLLKKQGFAPDALVTDKLHPYGAAKSEIDCLLAMSRACTRTIRLGIRTS
jgi:transposase-like protein